MAPAKRWDLEAVVESIRAHQPMKPKRKEKYRQHLRSVLDPLVEAANRDQLGWKAHAEETEKKLEQAERLERVAVERETMARDRLAKAERDLEELDERWSKRCLERLATIRKLRDRLGALEEPSDG